MQKNYLNEEELNVLNRMVTAYLELAELQALNRKPMYMTDWVTRLDDFLRMTAKQSILDAIQIIKDKFTPDNIPTILKGDYKIV